MRRDARVDCMVDSCDATLLSVPAATEAMADGAALRAPYVEGAGSRNVDMERARETAELGTTDAGGAGGAFATAAACCAFCARTSGSLACSALCTACKQIWDVKCAGTYSYNGT